MKIDSVELSETERLWLETKYKYQKQGKRVSYRKLKGELHNKIPKDFNPWILNEKGVMSYDDVSLLGIYTLTSDIGIIKKVDEAIKHIRKMLIENSDLEDIKIEDLTDPLNINSEEASELLGHISRLRPYNTGSAGSEKGVISISLSTDDTFNEYMHYPGIEAVLAQQYERLKQKGSKITVPPDKIPLEKQDVRHLYFKSNIEHIDPKLCFVLMPFTEEWSERVYNELIKNTIESLGLQCIRADNLTGQIVMEDIWVKIQQCGFIIAEVTGRNPNVLYELGLVHALNKPSILITQNLDDIPFDFTHLRHYEYQDNVEGFRNLEEKLPDVVKDLYNEHYSEDKDSMEW